MSLHFNTLKQAFVNYAVHEGNVAEARLTGRDAKAAMLRKAATLSDGEKAEIDSAVVGALQARFGIKAKKAEKQAKYSGYNFEHGTAASQALARARRLLKPTTPEQAEEMIAAMTPSAANSVDPVASMIAKFEKLSGGQKRSFLAQLAKLR